MERTETLVRLGELRLLTRKAKDTDDDALGQFGLFASKIEQFPADIARTVLTEWGNTKTFWPAWAELNILLDERVQKRYGLLTALEAYPNASA